MHHGQECAPESLVVRRAMSSAEPSNRYEELVVSDPSLAALSSILGEHGVDTLLDERSAAFAALRQAIRAVVEAARRADPVRVERLIVALRHWWRSEQRIRRRADDGLGEALWNRLVRVCIEEFYSNRPRS
jgi:hypothetical protein